MPGDNTVVVAAAAFAAGGLACYLLMSGKKSKSEEAISWGKSKGSEIIGCQAITTKANVYFNGKCVSHR
jgi:hypothetical protein